VPAENKLGCHGKHRRFVILLTQRAETLHFSTCCLTMAAMVREIDGGIFPAGDDVLRRPMMPLHSVGALLERPRLQVAFARARHRRVTLVCGSSGTGKSTAIDSYLNLIGGATATYIPHPTAEELLPFARGLVTALEATHSTLRHGLVAAFSNARRTQRPPTMLAQWFTDHLGAGEMTIVLDDLHLVGESDEIAEFLAALIEHGAPRVRWILGARSSAMFPIAKWLAAELVDMHIDDTLLAFTADEAVALAARLRVERDRALEMFALAGSHAGCLTLALLTGNACGAPRTFEAGLATSITALFALLGPEHLSSMHALLQLPSLDDDLVERIPFGCDLMRRLDIEAPYAFRFPEQPRFTSAFTKIAKRITPADEASLEDAARMVVSALEGAERPAEAMRAAALDGNARAIVGLLERYGFALLNRGYGDVVNVAVRALLPEERRQNFVALTLEAMRESGIGRHDVADAWFSHAAQIAPDAHARTRVQFLYASDLLRRGRFDCIETLEHIAADQSDTDLQASAIASLGAAYGTAGRWAQSRECIEKALLRVDDVSDVSLRATVYQRAAFVAVRDHDVDSAERYAKRTLALATEHGHDDIAAAALSVMLFIAINCKDDIEKALTILSSLEACAQRLGSAFWRRYALLIFIDVESDRGNWADLNRAEQELANEEIENDVQHAEEILLPSRALRLACRRDFAGAYNALAPSARRHAEPQQKALRFSELAVYAAAARLNPEAENAIAAARATLRRVPFSGESMSVRARLNITLASILSGKTRSAAASLATLGPKVRQFPRLSLLHALLQAMLERQRGVQNHTRILEIFDSLHESGLGGVAMMIEAIPYGRFTLDRAS